MSNFKKAIIALFILLLGIPLALFGYTWIKLNSIHVDSKYDSTIEKVDGITNILLTGIDARPGEQASRTDAMMILTIDKNNNNIKLTSLARDTYVEIPGRDKGKLNTAYFWGKEELLFKTIENEFGIGIDKFVQVDNSLTRNNEGCGIGLTIAKSFVELHKGVIKVTSEINKGTKFIIELPRFELDKESDEFIELKANKLKQKTEIEFSDIYIYS